MSEPDISGEWAMIGFEDPVAVRLEQNGNVLTGHGCCAGLDGSGLMCCGSIEDGSIVNGRAKFGFDFDFVEPVSYRADVAVSADGRRMLGSFIHPNAITAWVRLEGASLEDGWLVSEDTELINAVADRSGHYTLTLVDAPAPGDVYSPDEGYVFHVHNLAFLPLIKGDLGPFWAGEMAWSEADTTLVAGPVPETDPSFPIALRLRYEDVVLREVEATLPSGDVYRFDAMLIP